MNDSDTPEPESRTAYHQQQTQVRPAVPPSLTAGGYVTIEGINVRLQVRYEALTQAMAGIAYTPHCSIRCPDIERDVSRLAWASGVVAQLINLMDPANSLRSLDQYEMDVHRVWSAGAKYARIIKENMAEGKVADSSVS